MPIKPNKRLAGSQVFLSVPTPDDMDEFLKLVQKSYALHHPWVSPPFTQTNYEDYLERIQRDSHQGFLIKQNKTHQMIGVININEIVRGCFQSGYLGFYAFLGSNNHGLMGEALGLVLTYSFNDLDLHRLEANIQPDNLKSIAFIKKHHFKHEGFSPNYLKINGEWKDHDRFAITLENYNKKI